MIIVKKEEKGKSKKEKGVVACMGGVGRREKMCVKIGELAIGEMDTNGGDEGE